MCSTLTAVTGVHQSFQLNQYGILSTGQSLMFGPDSNEDICCVCKKKSFYNLVLSFVIKLLLALLINKDSVFFFNFQCKPCMKKKVNPGSFHQSVATITKISYPV